MRALIRDRAGGAIWALAWMWPLIGPAVTVAQGQVDPTVAAAAGLIAFVGLYLVVVTNGFDNKHLETTRTDLVLLGLLFAVGVALLFGYASGGGGWLNVMLYVAVSGATMLKPKATVAWTLACAGVLVLWAVGPGRGFEAHEGADIAQTLFGMFLASTLVFTMKQMLRYVRLLRETRAELARTAVSEERLRFARDLHDLLGHTLSLIVVKAEVVRRVAERDPAVAAREAADIETIGRQALAEVRDAVNGYREPRFETEINGVRAALADAGIDVRVRQTGEPLPEATSTLFGWAVREASTNVIRHSQATSCTIIVRVADGVATLTVADNGVGAASTRGRDLTGTGLLGLGERFAVAGGTVTTAATGGFQLIATAPAEQPSCTTAPVAS